MFAQTIHKRCHFLITPQLMHDHFLLNQQLHIKLSVYQRIDEIHVVANVGFFRIVALLKGNEVPQNTFSCVIHLQLGDPETCLEVVQVWQATKAEKGTQKWLLLKGYVQQPSVQMLLKAHS